MYDVWANALVLFQCSVPPIGHYVATTIILLYWFEFFCVVIRLLDHVQHVLRMHFICLKPFLVYPSPYETRGAVLETILVHLG